MNDDKRFLTTIRNKIAALSLKPKDNCFELLLERAKVKYDYHNKKALSHASVQDYDMASRHATCRTAIEEFVCGFFSDLFDQEEAEKMATKKKTKR